jgi:glutaredoxin 3
MKKVTIYSTQHCPYCMRAKALLTSLSVAYEEVDLSENTELRDEVQKKFGWMTVPMIVVGDEFLGGFDDISKLHAEGKLLPKIAE